MLQLHEVLFHGLLNLSENGGTLRAVFLRQVCLADTALTCTFCILIANLIALL